MFMRKTTPAGPTTAPSKSPSYKPHGQSATTSNNNASSNGLPVLGRMNPSHVVPGTKVWVTDPKVLWRIGEVQSITADQQTAQVYVPDAPDEKHQTMAMAKLYAFDPSHIVDHDDIAQMNNMHEAPLLNVLRQRFEADNIYTFTADILLSINPYKTIPLLYDVTGFMQQHKIQSSGAAADDVASKRPPHLFTIAEKAYTGMKGVVPGSGTPQSIIVSGESGAGKTEASKYIMKYLATASKHASQLDSRSNINTGVHEKIEECVVLSNLILESFGNAKTSRNDNSSRFGKYIQIHYNTEGRMAGVSIRHFLLEKTRLVMPQANERNYHIFYQLLAGLKSLESGDERRLKLVDDVWNYVYLTRGDCIEVDGVDDAAEFEQLCKCMDQLGMDKSTFQIPLFELLAAILHLGNMQFEATKCDGSNNDEASVPKFPESNRGVNLDLVSSLLGVEPNEFAKKMVTQTTVTGRGSILEMKLTPDQAKNAMDAFCKYLYGEMFNHLISKINSYAKEQTSAGQDGRAKATKQGSTSVAPFIGILDIFGFEVMKKNSLEQLCINFTNETLQQQFNKHVFVLEQERYANEGIQFSSVEFKDNQPCLDLIQKPPTGLLPLLEEQMLLKRKTTDKQLLTIYHGNHLDKHPNYTKPRFECDEFVVRHYAGEVVYDINEFIAKNTDNLHDDLLDLMKRSTQPVLKEIFLNVSDAPIKRNNGSAPSPAAPGKRAQGAALTGTTTVSSRFRTQLSELMDVLWNTSPNYIKCIKPNNLKFPGGFSCELVRDQLIYSGVLEVVRIRQEGFPIRKRFDVFYELFWQLGIRRYLPNTVKNDAKMVREACEYIAAEFLEAKELPTKGKRPFAMGRQEVFLRYGQVEKLEVCTSKLRSEKAAIVQARLQGWSARKKYCTMRRVAIKLQALWRMAEAKAHYHLLRSSTLCIQVNYRRYCIQKHFQKQKRAANVIFRVTLRFLTHKRFVRWESETRAATLVQKIVRGYLTRTAAERARKLQQRSAEYIQSWCKMTQKRRVYLRLRQCATLIQSSYRSVKMRREFLRRRKASIVLEAFVRQFIQRRKFRHLKQRLVKLQAMVRKWKHRMAFCSLRQTVVYIQSKKRQRDALRNKERRLKAMRILQHAMKGWITRCHYLVMRQSAISIQYIVKSWLLRKEYRQIKLSARCVQTRWRKYHRTKLWQKELSVLFGTGGSLSRSAGTVAATSPSSRKHARMEESDRRMHKLRENPQLYFNLRPKAYGYNTLFHQAAGCGDFHVVKYMLDTVVEKKDLFYAPNGRGNLALHEACAFGQYEMAKFLLHWGKLVEETPAAVHPLSPGWKEHVACDDTENQVVDKLPHTVFVSHKTEEGPEQDSVNIPVGTVYQGYLKKRRETSRWMKRYVVLSVNKDHHPQLEYYANDKPATLHGGSSKTIDLSSALFKKSMDVPFAFEIHSPKLLEGRNKEGRLYFAAENELENQKWLAHLRNVIPSSIESRIFAMHRGNKDGKLEFVDFTLRKSLSSLPSKSKLEETPLHMVAKAKINGCSPLPPPAIAGTGGSSLEIGVSASAIFVTIEEEGNNNQQSTAVPSVADNLCATQVRTRTELEADLVKLALWLVENGADINALTARKETPLKVALQAKNYLVAKYLLDRGALAHGLSASEIEEVQRLKASLAKHAISSVGCSSSSSRTNSARSLSSFAASFSRKKTGASSATDMNDELPLLFLLKQPGKVRNSSYVSVFVELIGISNPQYLSRPRIIISVLDSQGNPVEMKQQVSIQPLVLPASLLWAFTWHMQTPLENLPHGACVVFELTISPTLSSSAGTVAAAGAQDYVPVCWTYIQVDQRTANSMPLNAEMYKYPMDLTLKKLQRVDAFINGEIYISQGPQ